MNQVPFTWKPDVGPSEVLAAGTALSAAGATLYQFGFYSSFGTSFLTLLNVQDLLLGAAICLPLALVATAMLLFASSIDNALRTNNALRNATYISFAAGIAIASAVELSTSGDFQTAPFVFIAFLGIVALILSFFGRLSQYNIFYPLMIIVLTIFPAALGTSKYFDIKSQRHPKIADVITEKNTLTGLLIATTSGYVFLDDGTATLVIPISEVKMIKRHLRPEQVDG